MRSQLGMKPLIHVTVVSLVLIQFLLINPTLAAERCATEPRCKCTWKNGKRSADCSNAGFTSIPTTLDPETQSLDLSQNSFARLEKDAFKSAGLLNLQTLEMKNCHIEEVNEHAFRDLKILQDIDLSGNNLTKLQPKTFDGNDGLKSIRVSQNPLRQLMPYQFPPLKNLRTLDFSYCELQSIDRKAFSNLGPSVETIWLQNNQLR